MIRIALAALALACVSLPTLAGGPPEAGRAAVIVRWGDWLVTVAQASVQILLPVLLPLVAAYIIAAIRKVSPWAALFLSQRRIEMMIQAGAEYGLNAVQGAAKGRTLRVDARSEVLARGTQYILDTAPATVIAAAGGADGIARRVFRTLDLDERANEANVLAPALAALRDAR